MSGWLEEGKVNKVSFSMAGKGHGQKSKIENSWNGTWPKSSFQHGWFGAWSIQSVHYVREKFATYISLNWLKISKSPLDMFTAKISALDQPGLEYLNLGGFYL
jgi:hypothetical protein